MTDVVRCGWVNLDEPLYPLILDTGIKNIPLHDR